MKTTVPLLSPYKVEVTHILTKRRKFSGWKMF